MPWVKIDDKAGDHPKLISAGFEAVGVWLTALCWSSRHLTDGLLPRASALRFCGNLRVWGRLIDAGLVETTEEGHFLLHDFLDYNPSAATVRDHSEKRAIAGGKGAAKRWQLAIDSPSQSHADRMHTARASSMAKRCPDPVPVPDPDLPLIAPPHEPDPERGKPRTVAQSAPAHERRKSRTVKTCLPEDWQPNDAHRALAASEGHRDAAWVEREGQALRDWATAGGRRYVDWDAMFRGWLRRAMGANGSSSSTTKPQRWVQPSPGLYPEEV